jgi:hypothetical protein
MMSMMKITALVVSGMALSGCITESFEGTEPYRGADSIIATGQDQGRDSGVLVNGVAAIAYDPDGCQNWIIDDGLEGYSSPRYDPVSGLPICNNNYPPGTVLGNYQSGSPGIPDRVSGPGIRTVVNR